MASAALPLVLVALVLRLCHGCNLERDEDRLLRLFATWKTDNRRVYNSIDEETLRFGFFSLHVRRADKTARHSAVENADEFGRPVRFSGWADYTAAEMAQHSGGLRVPDLSEQDLAPLDFEFRTQVLFGNWKLEHNKSYDNPAEENSRFANFQCYVRSADGSGASLTTGGDAYGRPTRFSGWADLTQPEMVSRTGMTIEPDGPVHYGHRGFIGGPSPSPWTAIVSSLGGIVQSFSVPAPPVHVDWRNHTRSIVTEVKDQNHCGACWAFSALGAIEGAWGMMRNSKAISLSVQQLISCDTNSWNKGCSGGFASSAFEWLSNTDIVTDSSLLFSSQAGGTAAPCNMAGTINAGIKIIGSLWLPRDEKTIAAYLAAYGPVSVSIYVNSSTLNAQKWIAYGPDSVLENCDKFGIADHEVLLVGFGISALAGPYWIAKNSWGTSWGDMGYVKIKRGANECGLTRSAYIPLLDGGVISNPLALSLASSLVLGLLALSCCVLCCSRVRRRAHLA